MIPSVLIIGGSGYLGQFLVDDFSRRRWIVSFTYNSAPPPPFTSIDAHSTKAFQVDLATGEGLEECFTGNIYDAIVNCAAISQPAVCERDPDLAAAINIPSRLLTALEKFSPSSSSLNESNIQSHPPLLIHLSTDQVYDGSTKSWWKEHDACRPVNHYGRTKLAGEEEVQKRWPHHVILRSSMIIGPQAPLKPVPRPLFLQFVDSALSSGQPTSFFHDEWRCPVYVGDIVNIIRHLIQLHTDGEGCRCVSTGVVYNMGGPERLSRVDIAHQVAALRGHDATCIESVPSASVSRGVESPADISMDSSRLQEALGIQMTCLKDALPLTFH